jgi:hypothetical protein
MFCAAFFATWIWGNLGDVRTQCLRLLPVESQLAAGCGYFLWQFSPKRSCWIVQPLVQGVSGVMEAYRAAVASVGMYGPTHIAEVIDYALGHAKTGLQPTASPRTFNVRWRQ